MESPFPDSQCWYFRGLCICLFTMSAMSRAATEEDNKWTNLLFVKVLLYGLHICFLRVRKVRSLSAGNCECSSLLLFWDQDGTVNCKGKRVHFHFQKKKAWLSLSHPLSNISVTCLFSPFSLFAFMNWFFGK